MPYVAAQETWSSEQFMSENGLLQNRVHVMVKDRWGALIIGTEGGLVRFDGHHFKQLGIRSAEGIRPSRVLDILPTQEGTYVIRDAGCRQYLFADDEVRAITASAPTRQYTSRFAGSIGGVIASVASMDPDSSLARKAGWPAVVRAVPLSNGTWCLRTADELLVYRDTSFQYAMDLPAGRSAHLFALGDRLFTFDSAGGIHRIDPVQRRVFPVRPIGMPVADIRNGQLTWRLFWDPQERSAAIIVDDRLYTLSLEEDGEAMEATPIDLRLPQGAKVGALVWLDGQEALALGTDNKGLFIYRKQRMRTLLCDGLSEGVNNAYNAQVSYGDRGVLTSTRGGARLFDTFGCSTQNPPIKGFNEGAIILDQNGRYWYGRGDTTFQYDPVTERESVIRSGLRPLCFFEEGDVLWMGAASGIYRIENGIITLAHPLTEGDLAFRPNDLCRTPEGQLWMATCSGVYRVNAKGGWEVVDGLEQLCARTLKALDGAVLVGTYGTGAYFCRKGDVIQLRRDEKGFLSHVHGFMPDAAGFIWMSTNQGLFRVKRSDLLAWANDTTQRIYYAYYGKRAGLSNAEFNGGCSPPYIRTRDGWASFPTMDGLVWFQPEAIPDAYPVHDLRVESMLVNGSPHQGALDLAADHRDLVISFSLAYWGDPENVQLEYTLGEEDWFVMAPGQRDLRLSSLSPGTHELRVRKVGAPLREDQQVLALPIRIEAPLYRKPWFIIAVGLATILLFFGAIRLNDSRLRRRNAELERKVADRTRELVEANADLRRSLEMKEMLVSIISHDIVTPLRFIARVATGVSRRVPREVEDRLVSTLTDLANSSEKLHENAQGLLQWIKRQDGRIELRPRNIVVHLLVEEVLERERERAAENGVKLNNLVLLDDTIRTDRNVLSIILHNAVSNAVTHSGGSSVTVTGMLVEERYRLTVKDMGGGMPEAALRHAKRVQAQGALGAMGQEGEREVQGLGLLIIADLAQLMGGEFTVDSVLGEGTTVSITLPSDSRGKT
ncbi:MAG: ATP-binding protein [Flavobacteriales bacterium]